MLDLFTVNLSIDEQFELLRANIKETYIKNKVITKRTSIKLCLGDTNDIGNNLLVITIPPKAKLFESPDDKNLIQILKEFELFKFFITYYHLIPGANPSKKDIKDFGYWIRNLTDIINPKIIVCIGEDAHLSYFKRKFILRENHGKLIGDYNSIPIFALYPISYYVKRSDFEDISYKLYMKTTDWSNVKKKYKEVIC